MDESDFRVPPPGPVPLPTPDHQRRITRGKIFEIGVVVLLVITGVGYLAWREHAAHSRVDPARTLAESASVVQDEGGKASGTSTLFGRQVLSFSQTRDIFDYHVELMGKGPESPVETAIIWLSPAPGKWSPGKTSLQDAVNAVGELGQRLVHTSADALDKAVKTMEFVGGVKRPHDKGVAATSDGWKITYVTYRNFDEEKDPQPVLYLILQRMSAGEDESLAVFNRTLYESVNEGIDLWTALRSVEGRQEAPG